MHSKTSNILGLDISTRMTGVCVFDQDGLCVYNESIDTRNKNKFPTIYSKGTAVKDVLNIIHEKFNIEATFIEQPFMFFNSGGSTAKTMSVLQRFNGIVSWTCFELFKHEPVHITATAARKMLNIPLKRGENAKEKCLQYVLDEYKDFVVEYTRQGNIKQGVFDRSDSYIIAKAGWETWKKENIKS
tara:strand:- start:3181 stop:3738 length:558 start_codon:yes stop_codon:yes gene_type:complete